MFVAPLVDGPPSIVVGFVFNDLFVGASALELSLKDRFTPRVSLVGEGSSVQCLVTSSVSVTVICGTVVVDVVAVLVAGGLVSVSIQSLHSISIQAIDSPVPVPNL